MSQGRAEQTGTPGDIYERPASRFVASFIGRCTILDGSCSDGQFRSQGGLVLPFTGAQGDCAIVLRPEHLRIAAAGDAQVFTARVTGSSYFGGLSRLTLAVGGETLVLEQNFPAHARPQVGDDIAVSIDPSQASVLGADEAAPG